MTLSSSTGFLSVDTVVNLYGVQGSDESRAAIVGGYNWIGDGGGGVFFWEPLVTTGENHGTIIVPTSSPTGRWLRVYSGPLDVRYFGAKGDGDPADTNQININWAIEATVSHGGEVYVPPGSYVTTGPIVINLPSVRLYGAGPSSKIIPTGGFDTIQMSNTRFIEVSRLSLDDRLKTAGTTIQSSAVGNLTLADLLVLGPVDGIHLHNFNHVNVDRVLVTKPRGSDGYGFWLSGGGSDDPRSSDAISFEDCVVEGKGFDDAPPGGFVTDGRRHGLIIDGAVNTVSVSKFYVLAMQGAGVWFRNFTGSAKNPEFCSFYGLEVDFPQFEGIRIDVGQRLYFTDTMIHQSLERTNISVGTARDSGVNTVSFKGGFLTSAASGGMEIWGHDVCVQGMNILFNSRVAPGAGGAAGIELVATARRISISGNVIGDPAKFHAFGIRVDREVDDYAIVGNVARDNHGGGVRNIPGTSPGRRVVVANTGAVV